MKNRPTSCCDVHYADPIAYENWFEGFEAELREQKKWHWKKIHSTKNPELSEHFGRYKQILEILGE